MNTILDAPAPPAMPPSPLTKLLRHNMSVRPGAVAADFGCGAGDLTVEAILQGAARCYAFDPNPNAVSTTREHARRLGVCGVIPILGTSEEIELLIHEPVDLVLANPPQLPELPGYSSTPHGLAYDAGPDGRRYVELTVRKAAVLLTGSQQREPELQMVTTSVVGISRTIDLLKEVGFETKVVAQQVEAFRPVYLERLPVIPRENYEIIDGRPHETLYVLHCRLTRFRR